MPATIDFYVNTSSPRKRNAFVAGFSTLSAAEKPEFVVRTPTLLVRIHPMTVASGSKVGVTEDWGNTPQIKFGAKLTSTFVASNTLLFFADDFTKDATDPEDIFYYATLSLNTEEFVEAFNGASEIAIKVEIELEDDTVAQQDGFGLWDVIRGSEGLPTTAVPPYPLAPVANTLLGGNADGTEWQQRTVTEVKTLLGISPFAALANEAALAAIDTADEALLPVKEGSLATGDLGVSWWILVENTEAEVTTAGAYVESTARPGYVWVRIG